MRIAQYVKQRVVHRQVQVQGVTPWAIWPPRQYLTHLRPAQAEKREELRLLEPGPVDHGVQALSDHFTITWSEALE